MAAYEVDTFALLDRVWERLQLGSADAEHVAEARGYLLALREIGAVTDVEADGWLVRFDRCPSGGESECHAPIAWCNYCGDVSQCPNSVNCCGSSSDPRGEE